VADGIERQLQLMPIWCNSQPPPDPGTSWTVPAQCWVPLLRTDVVRTATVAAWLDWLTTRAELKVIERVADIVPWKLR
jgi:hypothetical protein